MKNKQKTTTAQTINGTDVTNVALSKSGVPQLGSKLNYMTIGRTSGSVRDRSIKKENNERIHTQS
jgi:hypothetical protein